MNQIDQTAFTFLNASSESWSALAYLAYALAKFVIYLIPIHLILLWMLGDVSVRRQALTFLAALLFAIVASYAIGQIFPTDRPFVVPLGHALMAHRESPSFPSNHALIFFTYASAMALNRHWRHAAVIGLAGLAVGWSRIYMGVHFPLDIAGGALLGLIAAWMAIVLDRRFGAPILDQADAAYATMIAVPRRFIQRR